VQQARNLLMDLADARTRVKSIIHDQNASFDTAFDEAFRAAATGIVRSATPTGRAAPQAGRTAALAARQRHRPWPAPGSAT
jgi:hypothetical protein